MEDRVGDVLARRAALESGAGAGVALSVLLHAGAAAAVVYAALHQTAPQMANVLTINLTPITPAAPARPRLAPVIREPAPVVEKPKPAAAKPEPKTVPLSPFGKSPKKGSEVPAPAPPPPAPAAAPAPEIPIGGTGATIEGDFPYTIYVQTMNRLIGQHWARPEIKPGSSVTVSFTIDRDGGIRDVAVEKSSGSSFFDRAAQRAVLETSPLQPLPFGYNGTYLVVHLIFK